MGDQQKEPQHRLWQEGKGRQAGARAWCVYNAHTRVLCLPVLGSRGTCSRGGHALLLVHMPWSAKGSSWLFITVCIRPRFARGMKMSEPAKHGQPRTSASPPPPKTQQHSSGNDRQRPGARGGGGEEGSENKLNRTHLLTSSAVSTAVRHASAVSARST